MAQDKARIQSYVCRVYSTLNALADWGWLDAMRRAAVLSEVHPGEMFFLSDCGDKIHDTNAL